jgi:hypothetical protein
MLAGILAATGPSSPLSLIRPDPEAWPMPGDTGSGHEFLWGPHPTPRRDGF